MLPWRVEEAVKETRVPVAPAPPVRGVRAVRRAHPHMHVPAAGRPPGGALSARGAVGGAGRAGTGSTPTARARAAIATVRQAGRAVLGHR